MHEVLVGKIHVSPKVWIQEGAQSLTRMAQLDRRHHLGTRDHLLVRSEGPEAVQSSGIEQTQERDRI